MVKASSAAAFKSYIDEAGGLPAACVLGHFSYFTVCEDRDAPVAHDDVERAFSDLGLNPDFLPAPNRPVDAYKKATKDAEAKGGARGGDHLLLPDGKRMNLLVRDVKSDRSMIVRHLVRELVDSRGARLDYAKVGEAVFYHAETDHSTGKRKSTGHRLRVTIDFDTLTEAEKPRLERVRQGILNQYDHDCKYIDGMKLRAMVRDYVTFLNATQLKPSCYFVHKSRADEMVKLVALLDRLKNGSSMVMFEMVDVPAYRQEVIEKFQAEQDIRLVALIDDIEAAMSSQTRITGETLKRFRERYRHLLDKSTEYTRTLGLSQERVAIQLERAMRKVAQLQEKLIEDEAARQPVSAGA